jgi:hypothetical protein
MTCRAGHSFLSADAFLPFDAFLSLRAAHSVILSNTLCHSEAKRGIWRGKTGQRPRVLLQILHFVQDDKSGCVQDGRKHRSG